MTTPSANDTESPPTAPYRLVVFWKEDPRTKKTFLQYREVQVIKKASAENGEGNETGAGEYVFYPLLLSEKLEALMLAWHTAATMPQALALREGAITEALALFDEAMETSDNPHCETFIAQTALNHLTTIDLLFNVIFFADELPLFFDQATVAKAQQTGSLYVWLDPYLAGLSKRLHKPLDTDEADWPAKEELYCYFKRKSDPTVSPQQLANLWRTNASRIVEIDEECRQKLWEWLKGKKFSEDEIRALILP